MGRTADYSRQSCSVAATLEVIGDPWTMLVIRDAFNGVRHGVLEPRPYSERPPRNEYVLTPKGKDLYGVLITLHAWGEKHVYDKEPSGIVLRHKTCGHDLKPRIACGCCNEMVHPREVEVVFTENRPTVGDVMPGKDEAA